MGEHFFKLLPRHPWAFSFKFFSGYLRNYRMLEKFIFFTSFTSDFSSFTHCCICPYSFFLSRLLMHWGKIEHSVFGKEHLRMRKGPWCCFQRCCLDTPHWTWTWARTRREPKFAILFWWQSRHKNIPPLHLLSCFEDFPFRVQMSITVFRRLTLGDILILPPFPHPFPLSLFLLTPTSSHVRFHHHQGKNTVSLFSIS